MRGMRTPLGAALALALTGLPALAQTRPATPAPKPAAAPAPAISVSPTLVAATVNGQPIYEIAIQRALERVPPAKRDSARPDVLNYLVDNLLIEQHLVQQGIKVEKAEVDKHVKDMRAELKKAGKDFDKMLADIKVNESELREHISADRRWHKYAASQANDKVLRELFDKNKDMFDGTAVRARHVLITAGDAKAATVAIAELQRIKKEVLAAVETGLAKLPAKTDKLGREKARGNLMIEAFAVHAKKKSECPTKANGGDVGWFQKAGFMVAPFSNAAFALQPYQMSDVVKSPFGYHLILVTDRKPGRTVKFEDVKEMVKEVYCERLREGLAAKVRGSSKIVVNPAPKR